MAVLASWSPAAPAPWSTVVQVLRSIPGLVMTPAEALAMSTESSALEELSAIPESSDQVAATSASADTVRTERSRVAARPQALRPDPAMTALVTHYSARTYVRPRREVLQQRR
jgi:hypothetical protein